MPFRYNPAVGLLILRVALAMVFIGTGAQKLFGAWGGGGIGGTTMFFDSLGIPLPQVMAVLVGIVEFFGGLMLALGLLTQVAALLLACVMLVAILTVNLAEGFFVSPGAFGFAWPMLNMAAALALVFAGPGRFSIDAGIRRELDAPRVA
jgi:putative oxidoreductase